MQITRTADVGVRIMTHLAMRPDGTRMTVAELAGQRAASVPFAPSETASIIGVTVDG